MKRSEAEAGQKMIFLCMFEEGRFWNCTQPGTAWEVRPA